MTTPIKTQCPHCKACFKIQSTQLNKENATVSCNQCQQSFLVNKNLVVTSDTTTAPNQADTVKTDINNKNGSNDSKSSLNKQRPKKPSSDILIYDDMDAYEPEEPPLEYDSLESMDAWLDQINNASTLSANEPSKSASETINQSTSSAVSNDIHANVDEKNDDLWLEKLLKDQNKHEDMPKDDTDLSRLLLDMGVPLKDEDKALNERRRKTQESFIPTPKKRSATSLLWILGCLVLALLLFAQYVIFNLETLVKNPAYAERLQAICSAAACSLPNADINAWTITHATHKSSQIKRSGKFSDISATLSNQSANTQLYPSVKVSVYGENELIGEFIADPGDYLLSKQSQLAAESSRNILFTVPVSNAKIRDISVSHVY